MKTFSKIIQELSYKKNMGAVEMFEFFQKASNTDIQKMKDIVEKNDWEGYKKLIKKVLGIELI